MNRNEPRTSTSLFVRHDGSRRGFTLIELLVVIAIIALLIGVIMPAMSSARKTGRAVQCQSHLRALGGAAQAYADAYNFIIPLGEADVDDPSNPTGNNMHFAAALLPGLGYGTMNTTGVLWDRNNQSVLMNILREQEAFQCPEFPNPRQVLDYVDNVHPMPYIDGTDSSQNSATGDTPAGQVFEERPNYRSLDALKTDTSQIIYLTEGNGNLPDNILELHDVFFPSQLPFGSLPRVASDRRHPWGIHMLFYDMHVDRVKPEVMDSGPQAPIGERLRFFTTVQSAP